MNFTNHLSLLEVAKMLDSSAQTCQGLNILMTGGFEEVGCQKHGDIKKACHTIGKIIYAAGDWKNDTNNLGEEFKHRNFDFNRWQDLVHSCKSTRVMLKESQFSSLKVLKGSNKSLALLIEFIPKFVGVLEHYAKVDNKMTEKKIEEIGNLKWVKEILTTFL